MNPPLFFVLTLPVSLAKLMSLSCSSEACPSDTPPMTLSLTKLQFCALSGVNGKTRDFCFSVCCSEDKMVHEIVVEIVSIIKSNCLYIG